VRYTRHPERRLFCATICITAAFVSAGIRDKSFNLRSYGMTRPVLIGENDRRGDSLFSTGG
jgi:hypothetical protein